MAKVDHLVCPASAGDDLAVVLVPVLPSQSVHGSPGEAGYHVRPVNIIEGHRHLLPWSEVLSSHLVTMGMDNFFYSCLFHRSSFLAASTKTMMAPDSLLVRITASALKSGDLVVGTGDGGDGDQVLLQVHLREVS
jgi:hypothetical protein